jgi:hypothetical protein
MKNLLHIVYVPFTGVGLHGGFRGNEWYKHRIEIFKKFTLKSLLNQSNKKFILWISFREQEQNNPHTIELAHYLKKVGMSYVFTFNGLMYWDDKFTNYNLKTMVRNVTMMLWDAWNYKEWPKGILKNVWENKNKTLKSRLDKSLLVLDNVVKGADIVYLTRIDSDDMFHRLSIDLIQKQHPTQSEAFVFDKGYIYNVKTGQLADWNPPTNPPFHTIIFLADVFFNSEKHLAHYKDFKTHEDIPRVFKSETLDMGRFCVSYHGKHISTGWDSPLPKRVYHKLKYGKGYCYTTSGRNISTHWESRTRKVKNFMIGKEYEGEEKSLILKEFGL